MSAVLNGSFAVKGMSCTSCAKRVEKVLSRQPGVQQAVVNFDENTVSLNYDSNANLLQLKDAVQTAGFELEVPIRQSFFEEQKAFWSKSQIWKRASFNTLNCLIGCSIGDFSAVVIMQSLFPGTPMSVQMVTAIIAGLFTSINLESLILRWREKFSWRQSFVTALSMSFLSMIAMESAMNLSDFMITGGKSSFHSLQYWLAFVIATVVGFLVPLPYNYYKLKKHGRACH